ncbi:hypothetical protein GO986_08865 [Deinococcus sp. HMF7620]|uniref:Uncharacterized protein n=1 Tax=Deinococcus arboris TaxID=2682977 RepID=A0A7C9HRC1_9DEIO|nr:hypothetical protein [Deinococcus arboris]MVN86874.1 hypothetical protein [Deinococcus arboris]
MSFEPPNYTKVPNKLFWLLPLMGEAELKVTMVIIRDTFGWNADGAATARSLTELMALTGLSKQGVLNGLNAGQDRGTLYKISGRGPKAAYGLVVNEVDRSTELTGLPSRPELVNVVDRAGQPSRPVLVNEVDRQTPSQAAPSAGKRRAERKGKTKKEKERQTAAAVRAREGNQDTLTAAAGQTSAGQPDASTQTPSGAFGTVAPGGAGAATARPVSGLTQPSTRGTDQATSTEKVPGAAGGGAALAVIAGALGGLKTPLPDLMAERDFRAEWANLPVEDVRRMVTEARQKGGRYRGALIAALDEAAVLRLTPPPAEPTPEEELDFTALLNSMPLDGTRRRP